MREYATAADAIVHCLRLVVRKSELARTSMRLNLFGQCMGSLRDERRYRLKEFRSIVLCDWNSTASDVRLVVDLRNVAS